MFIRYELFCTRSRPLGWQRDPTANEIRGYNRTALGVGSGLTGGGDSGYESP